jgi:GT2 family glycosyltransferase
MIYFLTVNYYSSEFIKKLIQSINCNIQQQKIIILNNSILDTDINQFASASTHIINSKDNLGFGAGCNIGIKYIFNINPKAIIWLINPDATIHKNAVQYVFRCFENDSSIAILGTKIQNSNGKIWFSSGSFNKWTGNLKHISQEQQFYGENIGTQRSRWVCGCSLIINLTQFDQCPQFDNSYFLYAEDADLCERYYQKGYHIAITNHILVTHQVSGIIGKDQKNMYYHYTFSRLYFLQKNGTYLGLLIYMIYVLIKILVLLPLNLSSALGRWQGLQKFLQKIKMNK